MRRVGRVALPSAISAVVALAAIGPGLAQADSSRTPVTDPLHSGTPNGSRTFGTDHCSAFPILAAVVANNEYQQVTTLADGTTITDITGHLVLSFTNVNTGYAVVRNVSGPTTEIDYPDGTGTFVGRGNNWFGFGPHSQANTGEPGAVITTGRVTLQIGNGGIASFSLNGTQENLCTTLGG